MELQMHKSHSMAPMCFRKNHGATSYTLQQHSGIGPGHVACAHSGGHSADMQQHARHKARRGVKQLFPER